MSAILLDGRALTDLVFDVLRIDGQLAPSVSSTPAVTMANAPSVLGATVGVSPRRIAVKVEIWAATIALRDTLLDTLWRRIGHSERELSVVSSPSRAVRVTCDAIDVTYYDAAHGSPVCALDFVFLALDPRRRELQPQLWTLSSARRSVPIGTEVSAPRFWLYGNATPIVDPVVIVRRFTGEEVSRLTLDGVTDTRATASLGANNALLIDSARQSIEYYVSGVRQTGAEHGLSWYGDGQFPVFSPEDCAAELSAWGTIEVSATSGTPTGLLTYYRGY